jgi:hypothetical protein
VEERPGGGIAERSKRVAAATKNKPASDIRCGLIHEKAFLWNR